MFEEQYFINHYGDKCQINFFHVNAFDFYFLWIKVILINFIEIDPSISVVNLETIYYSLLYNFLKTDIISMYMIENLSFFYSR